MKLAQLIFGIFLLVGAYANGQTLQENFKELTVHEGENKGALSQRIRAIERDSNGFLWLGTNHGLLRYDGYEFRSFPTIDGQKNSISSNDIYDLQADKLGVLWVATNRGVCKYNPETEDFTRYLTGEEPGDFKVVLDLELDQHGTIWVVTGEKVYKSMNGGEPIPINNPDSLFAPRTIGAFNDKVVVGGPNGFYFFSLKSNKWSKIAIPDEVFLDNPKLVNSLLIWDDTLLYFGTYNGLYSLNLTDTTFKSIKIHTDEKFKKQSELIGKFGPLVMDMERSKNKLWVAYRFLGLAELQTKNNTWKTYTHSPSNPFSLMSNRVYSLLKDPFHNLWVGSIKGLQSYHDNEEIETFGLEPGYLNIVNYIPNLFEDSQKRVWVSSVQGLYLSPKFGENAVPFPIGGSSIHSLRTKDSHVIVEDLNGTIWIGGNKNGVHKFENNTLERVDVSPNFNRIHSFEIQANQVNPSILWMATLQGFFRFNTQTFEVDTLANDHQELRYPQFSFLLDDDTLTGFSRTVIYQLNVKTNSINLIETELLPKYSRIDQFAKAKSGKIWMATTAGLLVLENGKVKYGLTEVDMRSQRVYSVVVKDEVLWFNTHNKMYSLTLNNGKLKTYMPAENSHQEFSRQSISVVDGNICFGGSDGISVIRIKSVKNEPVPSQIRITKVVLGDSLLPKLNQGDLEFENEQNSISFQYSALNFDHSYQPNYRYRMVGLDEDWKYAETKHEVDYTHLPDGDFTFEVQSSSLSGDWSQKPAQYSFTILPPFWKTIWFKLLAFVFTGLLVGIYVRVDNQKKRLQQEKLLAEQRAAYKSKFLANMSHEIRTPLNAIMGLNHLLKDSTLKEKQSQWVDGIEQSSSNLMRIVNDILDQEKIESGKYTFVHQSFNLKMIVNQSANYFRQKADKKGIEIRVHFENDLPEKFIGDPVRMSQIINNLVANAVKFTEKGHVLIHVKKVNQVANTMELALQVIDTGIGIRPEKLSTIFESFEQARETDRNIDDGAGLGLSIAKQLVDQFGGNISVSSKVNKGTKITVVIALEVDNKKPEEGLKSKQLVTSKSNLKILLVEDLALNRLLATELLKNNYPDIQIDIAENGMQALDKIAVNTYDLVLMDIKMPIMDGYEATLQIRKNYSKKELPILALTANAINDQIEKCKEVGMNDCITKPIMEHDLVEKVNKYAKHES